MPGGDVADPMLRETPFGTVRYAIPAPTSPPPRGSAGACANAGVVDTTAPHDHERRVRDVHEDHDDFKSLRGLRVCGRRPLSCYLCAGCGIFSTWPGLILLGSLSWSLFALKMSMYALVSPSISFAILLSVSPDFTV